MLATPSSISARSRSRPDLISISISISRAQHGLVHNSFALRLGLITHLFLRVLPHPLPLGGSVAREEGQELSLSCFWLRLGPGLTSDTQGAIIRWLGLLCRHFAAASLAVPLGRSFDAARMLVFAAIAALVDAGESTRMASDGHWWPDGLGWPLMT
jgi:hypothetical protein